MYVVPKSQASGAPTSVPMMHPSGYTSGGHAHSVPASSAMSHVNVGYSPYGFKVPEHTSHSLAMYPQIPSQKQAPSQSLRQSPQHSPQVVPQQPSPRMMLNSQMSSPTHPHVSVPSPHLISPGSRRTPHSPHLRSTPSHMSSPSQQFSSPSPHMTSHHPHMSTHSPRLMSPHSQSSMASHSSRLHTTAELPQSSEREGNAAPLDLSKSKAPSGETHQRVEAPPRSDSTRTEASRSDAPLDLSVKPIRKRDHDDDVIVVGGEQHIPFKARRMSEYTTPYSYHPSNIQYMAHSGYSNGGVPVAGQTGLYRQNHTDYHQSRTPSRGGVIQSPQGGGTPASYYPTDPSSGKPPPYHQRQQLAPTLPSGTEQLTRTHQESGQQRMAYAYATSPYKVPGVSRSEPTPPHPTTTASMGASSSEIRYPYSYVHNIGRAPLGSQHQASSNASSVGQRFIYPAPTQPGNNVLQRQVPSQQPVRQPPPLINPNTTSGLSIPRSPRTVQERTVSYQQPSPNHHIGGQRPPSRSGPSAAHVIGTNTPGLAPASSKQLPPGYPQQKYYTHSSSRMMPSSGPALATTGHSQWPHGPHLQGSLTPGASNSMIDCGYSGSSTSSTVGSTAGLSSVNQSMIRSPPRGTLLRAESPRAMSHPPSPSQSHVRHYPHPSQSSTSSSSSSTSHIDLSHGTTHLSVPRPGVANKSSSEGLRPNHFSEPDLRSMYHSPMRSNLHPADPGGRAVVHKPEMASHSGQQMVRILPFQQSNMAQPVRVPQPGYLIRPHNTSGASYMQVPGPHGPHSITVSLNPNQVSNSGPSASDPHQQACNTSVASSAMAPTLTKPWSTYSDLTVSRHHSDGPVVYGREDGPPSVLPVNTKKSIPVANVNPIIVQPKSPTLIHPKKLMLYQSRIDNSPGPLQQSQQKQASDISSIKQGIVSTKTQVSEGSGNNVSTLLSEALHSTFKRMLTNSSDCKSENKPPCHEEPENGDNSKRLDFSKLTRGLDKCPEAIVKMERDQKVHLTENVPATELKIPVVPLKERMKTKDHFGRASPICSDLKKKTTIKKELEVKKPKIGRPRDKSKCKEGENAKIHRYYKVKSKIGTARVKSPSHGSRTEVSTYKKHDEKMSEGKDVTKGGDRNENEKGDEQEEYEKEKREDGRKDKHKGVSKVKEEIRQTGRKRVYVKTGQRKQKTISSRKDGKRRKESSGVVITARTRNQTAATKGVRRLSSAYNKNAAYERELKREEYRKLIKRFKRQTRQLGNRESRRVTRERLGVIFQSDTGSENDDAIDDDDNEDDDDDEDIDDEDEDVDFVCKQPIHSSRKSDEDEYEFEDSASDGPRLTRAKRRFTTRDNREGSGEDNLDENLSEDDEESGSLRDQDPVGKNEVEDKTEQVQFTKKTKRGMRGRGRIFRRRGGAWYDKKRDRKKKIRVKEENESPPGHDASEANSIAGQEVLSAPEMARRLVICKETGETLLHKAARLGHDDVVLYCLENGFKVNSRDNAGYTPLHETCVRGHVASARILIGHGADINANAHDGTRPMHDAVDNNNTEIVRMLLACGVDTKLVSFGGRNVMKLAKGDAMKEVLKGYFGDLNGANEEKGFEELAWRFHGSFTSEDPKLQKGCAILEDAPSDPEDADLDLEFDLCDVEHLTMYHLETAPNKGPCNYHVLHDVLRRLNVTKDEFMTSHPDIEIIEHYAPCLQHVLLEVDPVASTSGGNGIRRNVALVEATSALKALLGVETETIHWDTSERHEKNDEKEVHDDEQSRHDDDETRHDDETAESPGPTETVLDPVNGFFKTQKVKDFDIDYQRDDSNVNKKEAIVAEKQLNPCDDSHSIKTSQPKDTINATLPVGDVANEKMLATEETPCDDPRDSVDECDNPNTDKGNDGSITKPLSEAAKQKEDGFQEEESLIKCCNSRGTSDDDPLAVVSVYGTYVPVVTSVIGETMNLTKPISEVKIEKHTDQDLKNNVQISFSCDQRAEIVDLQESLSKTEAKLMRNASADSPVPPETPDSSTVARPAISPLVQLGGSDKDKVDTEERHCGPANCIQAVEGNPEVVDVTVSEVPASNVTIRSLEMNVNDSQRPRSLVSSDLASSKGEEDASDSSPVVEALSGSLIEPAKLNDETDHPLSEPKPSTSQASSGGQNGDSSSTDCSKGETNCSQENGWTALKVSYTKGGETQGVNCEDQCSDDCLEEPPRFNDNVTPVRPELLNTGALGNHLPAPMNPSTAPTRTPANCDIVKASQTGNGHNNPKENDQPIESRATDSQQTGAKLTASTTNTTTTAATAMTTTKHPAPGGAATMLPSVRADKGAAPSCGEVRKENNNNNVAEETSDSGLPVLEKHETEGEEEAPKDERTVEPSNDEASDDREMPKLTIQAY